MFLMFVPLVMVLVGLAAGGSIERLAGLRIRWAPAAFAALLAQWALVRFAGLTPLLELGLAMLAAHGLLLAALLRNYRLTGIKIAIAGAALNMLVMAANGGFMPITHATLAAAHLDQPDLPLGQRIARSKDVLLPPEQARLGALGDTMTLTWPVAQAFSIGDVAVACGIGVLTLYGMQPRRGPLPRIARPSRSA
jgi:hypothetical protein